MQRVDGQGQSGQNWRRGNTKTGGGLGAGYNSCDRGQLGQIWESWNLSLRKDDPTLSRSLLYHWPPLGTERGTSGMEISQFFKSGIVEM